MPLSKPRQVVSQPEAECAKYPRLFELGYPVGACKQIKKLPLQAASLRQFEQLGIRIRDVGPFLTIPLTTSSPEKKMSLDAIFSLRKTELYRCRIVTGDSFKIRLRPAWRLFIGSYLTI